MQLPHCTLALYGLGAGSLKGFAEQQQGLSSSFSGNLHFGGKFPLRRKLSSYSLHLRSQGRQLRGLFLSQEGGERIKLSGILFLSNYLSIEFVWCAYNVTGFVIYSHDNEGKTRSLLQDIGCFSEEAIIKQSVMVLS